MQVEMAEVMAVAGGVLGLAVTIYTATLKFALNQKEKVENERHEQTNLKIEQQRASLESEKVARLASEKQALENEKRVIERLHMDELETTKLAGNLALLRQAHDSHSKAVEDLERNVVTKQEFEARMDSVQGWLERINRAVETAGNQRYPYPSRTYSPSGGIPRVRDERRDEPSPSPPPPRPKL